MCFQQLPHSSGAPQRQSKSQLPCFQSPAHSFVKHRGYPKTAKVEPEKSPVAAPDALPGNANLRIGGCDLPACWRSVTAFFPASSALLPLSVAPERKSTPVFSIACTLFCESTGGTPRPV